MGERYVVRTDSKITKPMPRDQAIKTVKEYEQQGISAYIVSEDENRRLKNDSFNKPKWS